MSSQLRSKPTLKYLTAAVAVGRGGSYSGVRFTGSNPTLGWDFRGVILLWGEISGESSYSGLRFPRRNPTLGWDFRGGLTLGCDLGGYHSETRERGKPGNRVELPPGWNPTLGWNVRGEIWPGDGSLNTDIRDSSRHTDIRQRRLCYDHLEASSGS